MKLTTPSRFFLLLLTSLLSAATSFGLVQDTNGITSMGWQMLLSNLPANALALAASTDANNPDFVAIASDSNNTFYF